MSIMGVAYQKFAEYLISLRKTLRSLRLCGLIGFEGQVHRRDAEDAESTQRRKANSARLALTP